MNQTQTTAADLELTNLNQFYGTENYYKFTNKSFMRFTDGVKYCMDNGYAWLIAEIELIVENRKSIQESEFLVVEFEADLENSKGTLTFAEDKSENEFIRIKSIKEYPYTDARRSLKFYLQHQVLMLTSEY